MPLTDEEEWGGGVPEEDTLTLTEMRFAHAAGQLFDCYCTERPDWPERPIHDDECNQANVEDGTGYVLKKLRDQFRIEEV